MYTPVNTSHQEESFTALPDFFEYIDLAFAKQIGGDIDKSCLTALAYLMLAARRGHLHVELFSDKLNPQPDQLMSGNDVIAIAELLKLTETVITGFKKLAFCAVLEDKIKIENNKFYLQRLWKYQSTINALLEIHIKTTPKIEVDSKKLKSELEKASGLLEEQKAGITASATHALSIITGGPGTGKSYTIRHIIKILKLCTSKELRINITAPTGKAAANLSRAIPEHPAQTLHSLLQLHRNRATFNYINSDILIVDESSMIDAHMMHELLGRLLPGTRLIMLGDQNQLPPVEAGDIFAQIVEKLTPQPYCTSLKKCLRTDYREIIECANTIQKTDENLIKAISKVNYGDIIKVMDMKKISLPFLANKYQYLSKISKISLDDVVRCNNFRILSPLKRGLWGVDNINKKIDHFLSQKEDSRTVPIMILRNDYSLDLANGDCGLLSYEGNSRYLFIEGEPHQRYYNKTLQLRKIPQIILPDYQLAYAISIHKSQGSEFNEIFILWPEGSECFGRKALYTAVTRAKCKISLATNLRL